MNDSLCALVRRIEENPKDALKNTLALVEKDGIRIKSVSSIAALAFLEWVILNKKCAFSLNDRAQFADTNELMEDRLAFLKSDGSKNTWTRKPYVTILKRCKMVQNTAENMDIKASMSKHADMKTDLAIVIGRSEYKHRKLAALEVNPQVCLIFKKNTKTRTPVAFPLSLFAPDVSMGCVDMNSKLSDVLDISGQQPRVRAMPLGVLGTAAGGDPADVMRKLGWGEQQPETPQLQVLPEPVPVPGPDPGIETTEEQSGSQSSDYSTDCDEDDDLTDFDAPAVPVQSTILRELQPVPEKRPRPVASEPAAKKARLDKTAVVGGQAQKVREIDAQLVRLRADHHKALIDVEAKASAVIAAQAEARLLSDGLNSALAAAKALKLHIEQCERQKQDYGQSHARSTRGRMEPKNKV